MEELAILGGKPIIDYQLAPYRTLGSEERAAVDRVLDSGVLSGFVGAWCDDFYGGPEIRKFEEEFAALSGTQHALSMNSNTSGLFAAIGAAGISPGDEVIVPAMTMSATAMAPLVYGGVPVFVDIEPETFCLDVQKVRDAITPRTRAIIVVNLFGHPAALHELRQLSDERGLILIEDNAQAPLATENGVLTGAIGHIGVYSLNYHKHFHTGEGGVCTTNDDELALRLRLIRNHGENVVQPLGIKNLTNLIGFNYRMTELSAALGREQVKKASQLVDRREYLANRLTSGLSDLPGLIPPKVRSGCRHVYYVWVMRYDEKIVGIPRALFCQALAAEGFPVSEGYVPPLYWLPVFQQRIAIGGGGYPFNLTERRYDLNLCPVTEHLHKKELVEFHICSYEVTDLDVERLINAVRKVYARVSALAAYYKTSV